MPRCWRLAPNRELSLDRARVMAILNLTPDSFSDGGAYPTTELALEAAARACEQGADILDIGGESTRPGSHRVPAEEQVHRVIPVIREIRRTLGASPFVTIDTTLFPVARAALDAGADAVNDTSAGLDDPGMLPLVERERCGIILMHRLAPPEHDSYSDRYNTPPDYTDGGVVHTVKSFLADRAAVAVSLGIASDSIVIDPGLGFGKTVDQNLDLIQRTPELCALGYPILSGISRKSFTTHFASRGPNTPAPPPRDRLAPSLALSVLHRQRGAAIFRVHDVAQHVQALTITDALGSAQIPDKRPDSYEFEFP